MSSVKQSEPSEVLIKEDLRAFLAKRYRHDGITNGEIDKIKLPNTKIKLL